MGIKTSFYGMDANSITDYVEKALDTYEQDAQTGNVYRDVTLGDIQKMERAMQFPGFLNNRGAEVHQRCKDILERDARISFKAPERKKILSTYEVLDRQNRRDFSAF